MLNREYLYEDRPMEGMAKPDRDVALVIESAGCRLFGKLAMPAVAHEEDRTPLLLLLHGHPGNDRNLDLMFTLRRAGIAVAYFSYRGIWGSHGNYAFSHLIKDAQAAFAHLQVHAEEWKLDPAHFYVLGHSMGGFTAMNCLAQGLPVRGAFLMAPCDLHHLIETGGAAALAAAAWAGGQFTLAHEHALEEDMAQHSAGWAFCDLARRIDPKLPVHFIGGTQDVITPVEKHIRPAYTQMLAEGHPVTYTELNDGHSFSASRVALARTVFDKIAEMEK